MQMFESLKKSAEACEFCKQSAGSFKGCKYLDFVDKQDSSEVQCGNCAYAGNCLCMIRDGE